MQLLDKLLVSKVDRTCMAGGEHVSMKTGAKYAFKKKEVKQGTSCYWWPFLIKSLGETSPF